jgi:hypothetical protein
MHGIPETDQLSHPPRFCISFHFKAQEAASSKAAKRASPTTTAALAFENEIPTGAFEGFDEVEAGPDIVPEAFPDVVVDPVALPIADDFV